MFLGSQYGFMLLKHRSAVLSEERAPSGLIIEPSTEGEVVGAVCYACMCVAVHCIHKYENLWSE